MMKERIRKLDGVGFYEHLLSFHAKHLRWPTSREGKLGSWCFVQRKTHKKGVLSQERVEKLEVVGFPL